MEMKLIMIAAFLYHAYHALKLKLYLSTSYKDRYISFHGNMIKDPVLATLYATGHFRHHRNSAGIFTLLLILAFWG